MAGGSAAAVYSAIVANSFVMVAKFAGFVFTGSGTMLAEGIHSAADVGNQTLLAFGMKRAKRPADDEHPQGYGRDAFVWSLISAVGIFFLGCGVSIAHGVHSLFGDGHHEVGDQTLNLGILGLSLVAEGASLAVAVRALAAEARSLDKGFFENLWSTSDPFGVAILLEDAAAVFGVLLAFVMVGLVAVTHDPTIDAYGSILIGILLGFVAAFLILKNRSLLIGKSISIEERQRLAAVLADDPAIESVIAQTAVVTGADDYVVTTEIDVDGAYLAGKYLEGRAIDDLQDRVATEEGLRAFLHEYAEDIVELLGDEVDRIEARVRKAIPKATQVDVEVD